MVDDNSMLYRQMSSGETGTVPLSVAGVEVWVRAQLERGELTMAKLGESYARSAGRRDQDAACVELHLSTLRLCRAFCATALSGQSAAETETDLQSELQTAAEHPPIRKPPTRGHAQGGEAMGKRPMRTCRLAFVVPVEADADAPGDDGEGVEWRDVSCYVTEDVSLVCTGTLTTRASTACPTRPPAGRYRRRRRNRRIP